MKPESVKYFVLVKFMEIWRCFLRMQPNENDIIDMQILGRNFSPKWDFITLTVFGIAVLWIFFVSVEIMFIRSQKDGCINWSKIFGKIYREFRMCFLLIGQNFVELRYLTLGKWYILEIFVSVFFVANYVKKYFVVTFLREMKHGGLALKNYSISCIDIFFATVIRQIFL